MSPASAVPVRRRAYVAAVERVVPCCDHPLSGLPPAPANVGVDLVRRIQRD